MCVPKDREVLWDMSLPRNITKKKSQKDIFFKYVYIIFWRLPSKVYYLLLLIKYWWILQLLLRKNS